VVQEFPAIRFRAAKPNGDDLALAARALAAQRVAIEIHDRLIVLQKGGVASNAGDAAAQGWPSISSMLTSSFVGWGMWLCALQWLAAGDTCDLLVIDRGFDPVAPAIHEWTFEAMVADMLAPSNGLFQYDAETQEGQQK
jgi:syntaxin-binding protein 1